MSSPVYCQNLSVPISTDHITKGDSFVDSCPIALAIKEQLPTHIVVTVAYTGIWLRDSKEDKHCLYENTQGVLKFLKSYDERRRKQDRAIRSSEDKPYDDHLGMKGLRLILDSTHHPATAVVGEEPKED